MVGRKHNRLQEGERIFFPLHIEPILDALSGVRRSAYFQLDTNRTGLLIELEEGASQQTVADKITAILQEQKPVTVLQPITGTKAIR
jgi:hypothetical protein